MRRLLQLCILCVGLTGGACAWAADIVALLTKVQGEVVLATPKDQPLAEPFIKLREGDVLRLGANGTLTVTYFDGGRQESWTGPGSIKLGPKESAVAAGKPTQSVKALPAALVQQLAKTPAPDSDGKVGMLRLRNIPTPEALAKLEKSYSDLKAAAAPGDHNPDLFWLSGLFSLSDYDRLDKELVRLSEANPGEMEFKVLKKMYARAVSEAKANRS